MKFLVTFSFLIGGISHLAANTFSASGNWTLKTSEVTYTVSHPLKTSIGKSTKARGKVRCGATCDFLIAVPVVSFDSGDSNRDLHMLETTKGAAFPLITVRGSFKAGALASPLKVDFHIEFGGQKAIVSGVELALSGTNSLLQAKGTLKLKLSQFGITKPSLLGMAIDDEVPITILSTWETGK